MKKFLFRIGIVVLFVGVAVFFWPHSLAGVPFQPQSARVRIIDRQHEQTIMDLPAEFSGLDAVMELLDQYSYHCSFRTIPSLLDSGPSMSGNDAGFWVLIDLYSEANYQGEHFGIRSGGTKEIIFGRAVWRMGYWKSSESNLVYSICSRS